MLKGFLKAYVAFLEALAGVQAFMARTKVALMTHRTCCGRAGSASADVATGRGAFSPRSSLRCDKSLRWDELSVSPRTSRI